MITYLIKKKREGNHLAMCMMKSNSVIVRTYLEMSLHSSDMDRTWLLFVIHRIGIIPSTIFFNGLMLNLFESLLIILSSDKQ